MNMQLMSPSDILVMRGQQRWFHSIALRVKGQDDYVRTHKLEREPQSNYRLRDEPIQLMTTITKLNGDGSIAEIQEMTTEEASKLMMRVRGPRKQGAARAVRPTHVKIVQAKSPVPAEVAIAIYEDRTEQEIKIATLEAQIRELMGLLPKPKVEPKSLDLSKLLKKVEDGRIK